MLYGRSKSTWAGCGQSQYSKPYVLFSATDVASAAIDFFKSIVDDGVVDSPPSQGLRRSPIVSPSPLQRSLCRPHSDCSSSPTPRSSNTPHRQLYKHCADEAPLDAAVPVQVGCATAAVPFQVGSMNRMFPILHYPCLEDNLWTVCVDDGCQPHIVSEMKHGTSGGQHRRPEGKVHFRRSFPSKVGGIVSPGFCHPCLSEEVRPLGRLSGAIEQPPMKSSASRLPLRQLEQFAMIVIFNFVRIFLSVPLHQQVDRKGGMMNVSWIGLVGGQARSLWGTIPLIRRIFFVLFRRK